MRDIAAKIQVSVSLAALLVFAQIGRAQSPGFSVVTVASGATPSLTTTAGFTTFVWTLSTNVSSSTFSSVAVGAGSLILCENSTGGFSVSFPSNFVGFLGLQSTAANYCQTYAWEYDGTNVKALGFTAGLGGPVLGWTSNITAQSSSQSTVTLASSPPAGAYRLSYYADLNTACTTGANSVAFNVSWTDSSNARALQTGSLAMGSAQTTSSYLTGHWDIWVGSGNVTYTSTVAGSCASGTSSYDVHFTLENLQ